jgi:P-type Cu+ transporter
VLVPSPYSFHVSILSQCVTIRHPTALSPLAIAEAIQDAGFDIANVTGSSHVVLSDTLDSSRSRKAASHSEQCHFCQRELKSLSETTKIAELSMPPGNSPQLHPSQVRLPQEAAANRTAIRTIGYEAEVAPVKPLTSDITAIKMDGPLRLTLSVGGMTCASCSSTITQLISAEEGVTDISVNLMGNSATLVVKSKELITEVKDIIEHAGYEASVVGVEPLQVTPDAMEVVHGERTVALRIEGMFCE